MCTPRIKRRGLAAYGDHMNAINVIAPYKHLGMWVFDDPRVGLSQEPFVSGADAMIDRVVADIPRRSVASRWSSPRRLSLVTSTASIGCAPMRTAVIGIALRTSIWKAGCAQPCFDISTKRRSISTPR
jgi:hypothetical protein